MRVSGSTRIMLWERGNVGPQAILAYGEGLAGNRVGVAYKPYLDLAMKGDEISG